MRKSVPFVGLLIVAATACAPAGATDLSLASLTPTGLTGASVLTSATLSPSTSLTVIYGSLPAVFDTGSSVSGSETSCTNASGSSCAASWTATTGGVAAGTASKVWLVSTTTSGDSRTFLVGSNAASVGAVPEPATWVSMVGGFGLAGAALRRRRRQILTV